MQEKLNIPLSRKLGGILMKFSKYYNLALKNAEFFDVELDSDTKFFIDPLRINNSKGVWFKRANNKIIDFFTELLDIAREGNDYRAEKLMKNLGEINDLRIGYSLNKPKGTGFGKENGMRLYQDIKKSEVLKDGLLEDVYDCQALIYNVGADRISDLIANIILLDLIEFTQNVCLKYGIDKNMTNVTKQCWDNKTKQWKKYDVILPSYEGKPIILIPDKILSDYQFFSHSNVYNKVMVPFYINEELSIAASNLIRTLKNGKQKIYKKDIKKKYPNHKCKVRKFIEEHPEEYKKFKLNWLYGTA